jgi:hypothetical protein
MAKNILTDGIPKYQTMPISELHISRRGKHHKLISGILQQLEDLSSGSALIIPLDTTEAPLPALRSAITRATAARGIAISTYSDEKNLYVWKKGYPDSRTRGRKK